MVGNAPEWAYDENVVFEGVLVGHAIQRLAEVILRQPQGLNELFAVEVAK